MRVRAPREARTTLFVSCLALSYWLLNRAEPWLPGPVRSALMARAHRLYSAWFVRLAMDLKGAIIKIGQILSLRRDLLPGAWLAPLARLQDEVEPAPWEAIRPHLEACLPRVRELAVEPRALAAASYAQVHRARTPDGRDVVLKIRHPDLPRKVRSDLRAARLAVRLLSKFVPRLSLDDAYEAIRASLLAELDLAHEGKSLEHFRAQFEGSEWAWLGFPEVHWEWSSPEVLCLEYLPFPTLREALPVSLPAREEVFGRLARIWYHSVFRHGYFHADPHPGNILVAPDGRLFLIDFGMMGRVGPAAARGLREVLAGLVGDDARTMVRGYRRLGIVRTAADEVLLQDLFEEILSAFRHATPQSIQALTEASALQERSMDLVWKAEDLRFPHEVVLLFRAEGVVEGLATTLLPERTLPEALQPAFASFRTGFAEAAREEISELVDLLRGFPGELRESLSDLRSGRWSPQVRDASVDRLTTWASGLLRRLALAGLSAWACQAFAGFSWPDSVLGWAAWTAFLLSLLSLLRWKA